MNQAETILNQVRSHLREEYKQVQRSHSSKLVPVDALFAVTLLRLQAQSISVRRTKPFRDSFRARFDATVVANYDKWLDHPDGAIKWLEENLQDWEEGDSLGQYTPKDPHNGPVIDLFWLSIILCARQNKWEIPDLVLVVLVHEWAHAFTDRGEDADAKAGGLPSNRYICEGIAQYWAHYSLTKMRGAETAASVLVGLCKDQSLEYQAHIPWLDSTQKAEYEDSQIPIRPSLCHVVATPICEAVRQVIRRATRKENGPRTLDAFDQLLLKIIDETHLDLF